MKKYLSWILMAAVLLTVAFGMTACGGETPDGGEDSQPVGGSSDVDGGDEQQTGPTLPAALQGIDIYEAESLDYSGWQLAGGMMDGVEMEAEDVQKIRDGMGGDLQIIFLEAGKVNLFNGTDTLEGTYTTDTENHCLNLVFGEYTYYAIFTMVGEDGVLILVNDTEPNTALYMSLISET